MSKRLILSSLVAATLIVLIASVWLVVRAQIRAVRAYHEQKRQIAQRVGDLKAQVPAGNNPHVWEELTKLTDIACGNVFFSPQHASYFEMLRFQTDLEEKLRTDQPIQVETLKWIWNRLGQASPHGQQYIERFLPLFEEGAAQVALVESQ